MVDGPREVGSGCCIAPRCSPSVRPSRLQPGCATVGKKLSFGAPTDGRLSTRSPWVLQRPRRRKLFMIGML